MVTLLAGKQSPRVSPKFFGCAEFDPVPESVALWYYL